MEARLELGQVSPASAPLERPRFGRTIGCGGCRPGREHARR